MPGIRYPVGSYLSQLSTGHWSLDTGRAGGAAAGLIMARRRTHRAKAEASQEVQQQGQQAQQATAEQEGNFKKAFSVCLEAKEYMVKF